MHSYITAINESICPVISVLINDTLFFRDVIRVSTKKACPQGSVQILILDNREKVMHDLYVSIRPKTCYILKIHTSDCILIQNSSF